MQQCASTPDFDRTAAGFSPDRSRRAWWLAFNRGFSSRRSVSWGHLRRPPAQAEALVTVSGLGRRPRLAGPERITRPGQCNTKALNPSGHQEDILLISYTKFTFQGFRLWASPRGSHSAAGYPLGRAFTDSATTERRPLTNRRSGGLELGYERKHHGGLLKSVSVTDASAQGAGGVQDIIGRDRLQGHIWRARSNAFRPQAGPYAKAHARCSSAVSCFFWRIRASPPRASCQEVFARVI